MTSQHDQIPYDEMRRLCGLPDVRAYCARRDTSKAFQELVDIASRVWHAACSELLGLPVERAEDYALAGRKP